MKYKILFAAITVVILTFILAGGLSVRRAAAQSASNTISQWLYPGTSGGSNGAIPMLDGVQRTTPDPVAKVYEYYRKLALTQFPSDGNGSESWRPDLEQTVLVNNDPQNIGFTAYAVKQVDPESALFVVHEPRQTIIIKLASERSELGPETNILVVDDKH